MSGLNESKRRDFVSQLIVVLEQNAAILVAKGYDPATKITDLKSELTTADDAQGKQLEAAAKAKDATKLANQTLDVAYADGSDTVELIAGLLGKKDNLVIELRKLRKGSKPRGSNGNDAQA